MGILVPDFSGKAFSFSSLSIILAICHKCFYYVEIVPSIPTLVGVFIINGCWILSNAFSASVGMIVFMFFFVVVVVFYFSLVNVVYDIELHKLNHPCELGLNPTWLWCMIFFYVLLDSVGLNFVENFCIYIHQRYWSIIFFFDSVFVRFWD